MNFVEQKKKVEYSYEVIDLKTFKEFASIEIKKRKEKLLGISLKYTGLLTKINNAEYYIYKRGSHFYLVPYSIEVEKINNTIIDIESIVKGGVPLFTSASRCIEPEDLILLNNRFNNIYTRSSTSFNGERYQLNNMDLQDFLIEFKKLDNILKCEIGKGKNSKLDLVVMIYNYYKMRCKYKTLPSKEQHSNPNYFKYASMYGLIGKEHTAHCAGMSYALRFLYNHYGIKADVITTDPLNQVGSGHGMVKLYLDNGQVTYLDLAREVTYNFRKFSCDDTKKYDFFLKSKNAFFGKVNGDFPDFRENESVDICDSRGRIISDINTARVKFSKDVSRDIENKESRLALNRNRSR